MHVAAASIRISGRNFAKKQNEKEKKNLMTIHVGRNEFILLRYAFASGARRFRRDFRGARRGPGPGVFGIRPAKSAVSPDRLVSPSLVILLLSLQHVSDKTRFISLCRRKRLRRTGTADKHTPYRYAAVSCTGSDTNRVILLSMPKTDFLMRPLFDLRVKPDVEKTKQKKLNREKKKNNRNLQ